MKPLKTFLLALSVPILFAAAPMRADGGHGHGHVVVGVGGWGWGWGVGWGWGGWGGYYGYPGYYPGYGYGQHMPWGVVDTDIDPEEAFVYLDGKYIGTADDFDGWPDYLYLGPGHYRIEFRLPGYETVTKEVDSRPGMYVDFKDKMRKVPGSAEYGSYEHPKLEGGIRRYFAKQRRGGNAVVDPSQAGGPSTYVGQDAPPYNEGPPPEAAPPPQPRSGQYNQGWRSHGSQSRTHLKLVVDPPDAAVYVDDRFVGTAEEMNALEAGLSVAPGHHTVTVSRPGLPEKSSEITVAEGKTESLEIRLAR
jgi:hypothetical protein